MTEPELTPEEQETLDWLLKYARPQMTREAAVEALFMARTELFVELASKDFSKTGGDYGYGGEWFEHAETDTEALCKWIVEREKRILGVTLEEFGKTNVKPNKIEFVLDPWIEIDVRYTTKQIKWIQFESSLEGRLRMLAKDRFDRVRYLGYENNAALAPYVEYAKRNVAFVGVNRKEQRR